jgi:hypothetical protein
MTTRIFCEDFEGKDELGKEGIPGKEETTRISVKTLREREKEFLSVKGETMRLERERGFWGKEEGR